MTDPNGAGDSPSNPSSQAADDSFLAWSFGAGLPEAAAGPAPAPAADELAPGTPWDQFVLRECLGRGGMASVHRAWDPQGNREVALKILHGVEPERCARLRREGQLTAALRHPGIVTVHSAGEHRGRPYLAYELVPSRRTLADVLGGPEHAAGVPLVLDVARAMAHAHRQGVVHRDLKPSNVLLDAEGRPRVADLGLAWAEGVERLTRSGALVGTPSHMAPEQLEGTRAGPAADVWALGTMLYQALTGRLPFAAKTLFELRARIRAGKVTPPRQIKTETPPALEAVCLRALAARPTARHPDAAAFAEALAQALQAPGHPRPRSRSFLWAAVGGGALLFLAVGGLLLSESRKAAPPEATPEGADPWAEGHAHLRAGDPLRAGASFHRALDGDGDPRRVEAALRALIDAAAPAAAAALGAEVPRPAPGLLALLLRAQLDEGQLDAAEATLRATGPRLPDPLAAAFAAELRCARGEAPEVAFQAARARWPREPHLRLALAECLLVAGEGHAARSALGTPRAPATRALSEQLSALLERPRSAPARALLQRASPRRRRLFVPWLLRESRREAAFLRRRGDPRVRLADEALPAITRRTRAEEDLRLLLAWAPPQSPAAARARACARELRLRPASQALRCAPPDPPRLPAEQELLAQAQGHLEAGRLAEAETALFAIPRERRDPLCAGALLVSRHAWEEAIALLEPLRQREPNHLELVRRLERALSQVGRVADAQALAVQRRLLEGRRRAEAQARFAELSPATYTRGEWRDDARLYAGILALDPLHHRARAHLGLCRLLLGERRAGLRLATRALTQDPSLLTQLMQALRTFSLATRGLFGSGSLRELTAGIAWEDSAFDRRARALVAAATVELEGYEPWLAGTLTDLDALLRADPALVWARALRGYLQLRAGRPDRARRDVRLAWEEAPDCAALALYQACLAAELGERPAAILTWLERARDLGSRIGTPEEFDLSSYPELRRYAGEPGFQRFLGR